MRVSRILPMLIPIGTATARHPLSTRVAAMRRATIAAPAFGNLRTRRHGPDLEEAEAERREPPQRHRVFVVARREPDRIRKADSRDRACEGIGRERARGTCFRRSRAPATRRIARARGPADLPENPRARSRGAQERERHVMSPLRVEREDERAQPVVERTKLIRQACPPLIGRQS